MKNNINVKDLLNWDLDEDLFKFKLNKKKKKEIINHKIISRKNKIKDKKNLFKKNYSKIRYDIDEVTMNSIFEYKYFPKKGINDKNYYNNLLKNGVFKENNVSIFTKNDNNTYDTKVTKIINRKEIKILNKGKQYFYNKKIISAKGKYIIGSNIIKKQRDSWDKDYLIKNRLKQEKLILKDMKNQLNYYYANFFDCNCEYCYSYDYFADYYSEYFLEYPEDDYERYIAEENIEPINYWEIDYTNDNWKYDTVFLIKHYEKITSLKKMKQMIQEEEKREYDYN